MFFFFRRCSDTCIHYTDIHFLKKFKKKKNINKKGIRNAAIQSLLAIPGEWGWSQVWRQKAEEPDVQMFRWEGGGEQGEGKDEQEELG